MLWSREKYLAFARNRTLAIQPVAVAIPARGILAPEKHLYNIYFNTFTPCNFAAGLLSNPAILHSTLIVCRISLKEISSKGIT
jgi:hypothetical protein